MKDGKEANFRLIGPKGRVLNLLQWDGSTLNLADATSMAESTEAVPQNDDVDVKDVESLTQSLTENVVLDEPDENSPSQELVMLNSDAEENNLESKDPPAAVSEPPLPKEDTPDVDEADATIDDVSGDDERGGITDSVLDEILSDESSPEAVEKPFKVDAAIKDNPKEPSGWLVKGDDKIAIIAQNEEPDADAIKRVSDKHPDYHFHQGPNEPELDSEVKETDSSEDDNSVKKDADN
jgi:hypothetical protein